MDEAKERQLLSVRAARSEGNAALVAVLFFLVLLFGALLAKNPRPADERPLPVTGEAGERPGRRF